MHIIVSFQKIINSPDSACSPSKLETRRKKQRKDQKHYYSAEVEEEELRQVRMEMMKDEEEKEMTALSSQREAGKVGCRVWWRCSAACTSCWTTAA